VKDLPNPVPTILGIVLFILLVGPWGLGDREGAGGSLIRGWVGGHAADCAPGLQASSK
jgi:hypothetical protein